MKLSNAEMQEIDTILEKYCNTKEALSMKNFCQHGSVSTYKHVMYVTRVCYYLNKHFGPSLSVLFFMTSIFTTGTKKMTAISGMDSPTRTQPC